MKEEERGGQRPGERAALAILLSAQPMLHGCVELCGSWGRGGIGETALESSLKPRLPLQPPFLQRGGDLKGLRSGGSPWGPGAEGSKIRVEDHRREDSSCIHSSKESPRP